jgi:hypothetical protein
MKSKEATIQERINFLQDLHRPLEDHWSYKFNFGLNPRSSDFLYKHHVSNLEDIYNNRKLDITPPGRPVVMSPASQLYGAHGKYACISNL